MRNPRWALPGHILAIVAGALLGTLLASAAASMIAPPSDVREIAPPRIADPAPGILPTAGGASGPSRPRLFLAWASGGLPRQAEAVLERLPSVRRVTTIRTGIDWVPHPTEELVDGAVPVETAVVRAREYADFIAPAERAPVRALRPGEALLAESSAALQQRIDDGLLRLVDRTIRVRGMIDDVAASGYEALVAGDAPGSWTRVDRFMLIQLRSHEKRDLIEKKLRGVLGPGQALRIRARGETPFLRYGDAVLPQLLIKKTFGEFSARPLPNGWIQVDPGWKRKNIISANIPVLGTVTCHRAMVPQLRAAMADVERLGLAHTIDRSEYGGCFGPRFIGLETKGRVSHHTWGIAIDINVTDNAFATKADQDPRLVEIMERHGFTWGGRWLVPDGMHFEWVEFP